MTIMLKTYAEPHKSGSGEEREEVEHSLVLQPTLYQTLVKRRAEISSRASAHVLWDSEAHTVTLLGTDDAVRHTTGVLAQLVSQGGGRKLVGRSHLSSGPCRSTPTSATATSLLLTSSLPPELTISSPLVSKHLGLGRTVSDSQTKHRRKLESEDSSYDSDQECVTNTLSQSHHPLSRSHDDISRTASETLCQEYTDYVSNCRVSSSHPYYLGGGGGGGKSVEDGSNKSRDSSPVLDSRLASVQETNTENEQELRKMVSAPQYNAKVEYGLKMGYPEILTQRALVKVGLTAGQDELLQELIRLHEARTVDPEEIRPKETQEQLKSSVSHTDTAFRSRATSFKEGADIPGLRPIVIDGSNVAMSHGNKETFSCRGIQICVDWFLARGHKDVIVFVPLWRKEASKVETPSTSQYLLEELERKRLLAFTPSRQVNGKRIVCHDDRYILNLAADREAIVVSNDNYRELINEKAEFKKVIEERILMYSFVNDTFMPPDDPLGRNGPSLDSFLRLKATGGTNVGLETKPCPYKEKCTYGNKCKFFHAERGNIPHKSVTERLKEQSSKEIQEVRTRTASRDSSPGDQLTRTRSMNLPLHRTESDMAAFGKAKQQLSRTRSSRPYGVTVCPDSQQSNISNYRLSKAEVSKTKSVENPARFAGGNHHLRSVPLHNLEMGCLSNYGAQPPRFPGAPGYSPLQPPPNPQDQTNLHRRLERQLTINPSFDPRINKSGSPQHSQGPGPHLPDMEYMRRHLPPPLCPPPPHQEDFSHQNVTRNASAPDSIRQWGPSLLQPLGIRTPPLEEATRPAAPAPRSPMQRLNSTSDTQLNRGFVNRALSSDPFSSSDTWKYREFSPLLGTSMTPSSSIWGAPPSPPKLDTPPPSPNRSSRLGPVGSRPVAGKTDGVEDRSQLHYHLCGLFPSEQVDHVMNLMPEEGSAKVLCAAIMETFPAK